MEMHYLMCYCFDFIFPSFVICIFVLINILFVATEGLWSCEKPRVSKLGVLPVKAMLAVEDHLWASSGGQVFIISTHTHCVEVSDQRMLEAVARQCSRFVASNKSDRR